MIGVIDVLADVLEATRTDGIVFARVRFHAPWGLRCDPAPLAGFHVVARGSCTLRLDDGEEPVHLETGDLALVTQGSGHHLYDAPGSPATPLAELMGDLRPGTIGQLVLGREGGPETTLLCGGYVFRHPGPHPLLATLPPVVHLRRDQMGTATQAVVDQLVGEVADQADGSKTVISRLTDVLLVHLLRAWIRDQPLERLGWLAALRDPAISTAVRRIHADYATDLSLPDLADECGLSLSTFKKRFRELVGEAPGAYLTRLRLDTAARLLRDHDEPVGRVAAQVGYGSEFAFNRAFARAHDLSPGRYRAHVRAHPTPSPVEAV